MIIFLPVTLVRTKHWNLFAIVISGLASILIYNNFVSLKLLVYDPNLSITSFMYLSDNFPSQNSHGIPFLWTLLRNSYQPLDFILVIINQLTKQAIFISVYNTIIYYYLPTVIYQPLLSSMYTSLIGVLISYLHYIISMLFLCLLSFYFFQQLQFCQN